MKIHRTAAILLLSFVFAGVNQQAYPASFARAEAKITETAGNKMVADLLQKLLNDPNDKVRASAADALGKIGDANAANPLRISLYDPNERVRESTATALKQINAMVTADELKKDGKLQEALNQYIADLKIMTDFYTGKTQSKLHKDRETNLRERIIKLALEMDPPPEVPDEAERFMVRGAAAVKAVEDVNGFKDAVAEFEKATLAAPWLANAYYNLGMVQDKAGLYEPAIQNLKLYLVAAPNAPDAKEARKLIYEIEYRKEKAAKEAEAKAKAAQAAEEQETQKRQQEATEQDRKKEEDFIRSLQGARYTQEEEELGAKQTIILDIGDMELICGGIYTYADRGAIPRGRKVGVYFEYWRKPLTGHETRLQKQGWESYCPDIVRISDDGRLITTTSYYKGKTYVESFNRER